MAHIEKFKATQVVGVLEHNGRTDSTRPHNHSNEDIDPSRTKYNYELHDTDGTAYERFKARMEQVHCMKRDDVTVLDSLIVTLPKNVAPEDERDFFECCYQFACQEYGQKNIVNATVHNDETSPHIHIGFIPVVEGKKRNGEPIEKVNHSSLINKLYLSTLHSRLSDYIKEHLGYEAAILNGATANGNKTVQELKAERAEQKAKELESKVESLNQRAETAEAKIHNYEKALLTAEADTKETKTVKGMFGKEKEIAKTETELEQDRAIVGAKLVLQREQQLATREKQLEVDRQQLANTVQNAVEQERRGSDEQLRIAVARAVNAERKQAEQAQKQLQSERDSAVNARQSLLSQLNRERLRSDELAELAKQYKIVNDALIDELPSCPNEIAEQQKEMSEQLTALTSDETPDISPVADFDEYPEL